jgi:hypothetical protein
VYAEFKSEKPSRFLNVASTEVFGLDGQKVSEARKAGDTASETQKAVITADQQGDRDTLKADSLIPAAMAAVYLGLMLYFASIGGYRRVEMRS